MIDNTDLDAMTYQLETMANKLHQARQAIDEARKQRVVDAVLSLPDGVWLARARDVVYKLINDQEFSNFASRYNGYNLYNMPNDFDRLLSAYEQYHRELAQKEAGKKR